MRDDGNYQGITDQLLAEADQNLDEWRHAYGALERQSAKVLQATIDGMISDYGQAADAMQALRHIGAKLDLDLSGTKSVAARQAAIIQELDQRAQASQQYIAHLHSLIMPA